MQFGALKPAVKPAVRKRKIEDEREKTKSEDSVAALLETVNRTIKKSDSEYD